MRRSPAALLLALAWSAALHAQQTTALAVRVVDPSNAPVARARLELVGTRFSGVSSDSGVVRMQGVPVGPALLRVTRVGYAPLETVVQIPAGAPFEADVELAPAAVPVRGVTARSTAQSPGLATTGFYRRRELGLGSFLTEDDIVRSRARRTSDLFRRITGVRVVTTPDHGYRLQSVRYGVSMSQAQGAFSAFSGPPGSSGTSSAPQRTDGEVSGPISRICFMLTILDGVPVQLADIDQVRLQSIGAVEVYRGPSEIPPEFNQTGAVCGAVVMWTRSPTTAPDNSGAPPAAANPAP